MSETSDLSNLVGQEVVLDTAGPMVYLGTLDEATPEGYWLSEADVHDRSEGQASKELYIIEAQVHGIRANRKRVFVLASTVVSLSRLADIVT